jgi:hypothetical protein
LTLKSTDTGRNGKNQEIQVKKSQNRSELQNGPSETTG